MGDIINLRQVRKSRKRAQDEAQAAANRAKHGRSKAEKRLADIAREKHDAVIDGAFRQPTDD